MSIVLVGSTSGSITLQEPAVAGSTVLDLPATSGTLITTGSTTGINASAISTGVVPQANGGTGTTTGFYNFKNRIINGAMQIDQRNAGASVTASVAAGFTYTIDRWNYYAAQASKFTVQQNAGSVTPPAGFRNYLGVTSTAATSVGGADLYMITQPVEGFNTADLNWGTASAQSVTLSFWVRSSLTGTFGGSILNSAANRSYPFSYTISSANTWEQKTVTITGETTGTWLTTNGIGMYVSFSLGMGSGFSGTAGAWSNSQLWSATGATSVVGTNGATFYITGVQLEKGSTATSFDYRPYGTELALCQRYYWQVTRNTGAAYQDMFVGAAADQTTWIRYCIVMPVTMRGTPSLVSSAASSYGNLTATGTQAGTSISLDTSSASNVTLNLYSGGISTGQAATLRSNNSTTATIGFSAEL